MKKIKITKKKVISFVLQSLLMIVAVFFITKYQSRNLISNGEIAPNIKLKTLEGSDFDLSKTNSKKTIIYFFAPWCTVCKFSSHNLVALRKAKTNSEMEIIAIALSWEGRDEIVKYAKNHNLNMPVLLGDDLTGQNYKIDTFPTIYILDKNKNIQDRVVGYTTEIGLRLRSL